MKQKVDLDSWERKNHFKLFNQFEEPFYGICVNVDCTKAYQFAKANKLSFFLCYLHKCLAAANTVLPFKYRIENEEVFIYDHINAGSTIGRANGTFGFAHLNYQPDLEQFIAAASIEVDLVKSAETLVRSAANNIIRFSALPWLNFTSITHARMFSVQDSCPKISVGKMTEQNGRKSFPVAVYVHHGLVDGLHVGQYIDCLQELMNAD